MNLVSLQSTFLHNTTQTPTGGWAHTGLTNQSPGGREVGCGGWPFVVEQSKEPLQLKTLLGCDFWFGQAHDKVVPWEGVKHQQDRWKDGWMNELRIYNKGIKKNLTNECKMLVPKSTS